MENVVIDNERCTLCGLCIPACVRCILEEGDETVTVTDQELCILCGHCKAVCPEDAPQLLSLNSEEFEPAPERENLPEADQLMALFRFRRSTRVFRKDPIEKEKLERIIEAGRVAPTGGNRQPLHYVVVHTKEKMDRIRAMTMEVLVEQANRIESAVKSGESLPLTYQLQQSYAHRFRKMPDLLKQGVDRLFYYAPAFVICHVDPTISTASEVDACLAAMQMTLMAETLGLGTCFCGFFVFAAEESKELKSVLDIPEEHTVPICFMLGYPDVKFLKLVAREPARVKWF